jgi:nucleoside-diphosphate-sugar epimerase
MSSNENNSASASPSNQPGAKRAIPGLPTEIVITHILKKDHFPDPGDLAQLRVVSREMRDAVDATGRTMEELEDDDYVRLGCVRALQRKHRAGRLSVCPAERRSVEKICEAAAAVGNLAELRILRAEGYPWDPHTCTVAAAGGHLEVLKWARENGCPWDIGAASAAAYQGRLETLKWCHENDAPGWGEWILNRAAAGGHLEIMKFALANGCEWEFTTLMMCEDPAVKKWAKEHGAAGVCADFSTFVGGLK